VLVRSTDEACSHCNGIKYPLQSVSDRPRCISEYHVAVVHPGCDKSVDKCLGGLVVQTIELVKVGKASGNMLYKRWKYVYLG